MAARRITVLVGDGHPLYREAVARVVRQRVRFELAAEVRDGRTALQALHRLCPDVAVLGLPLPVLDGERVLEAARRDELPTRFVLIAEDMAPRAAYRAVERGAAACLTKATSPEQLCEAIVAAGRGETFLAREIQARLAREIRLRSGADRPLLTGREQAVLRLLAEGHSTAAMAGRLQVAPATVKTHRAHLYEKLEVSDRAAAVAEAMRRELLE
jgi:two-component system nitrate/nitrite response regulator NarL